MRIEIKLKGFEEFLENRKVKNISKNSFALYNVNWFNVCCGLEKLDDNFEEEINKNLKNIGITINEDEIKEKLLDLFEDKKELLNFKRLIKNRLITCSEIEPPSFFEKLFTNSFGTFKPCDKRSPQSLLYLYDDYRAFLEKNLFLTKLERVLILIYCETRQHVLSKYISLEIIRKENDKKRKNNMKKILNDIMSSDKNIIKENDKILEEKSKLKYEKYKKEELEKEKERNRIRSTMTGKNIIIQKNKIKNLVEERDDNNEDIRNKAQKANENNPGFFSNLLNLFEGNKVSPIFELTLTPKEREAYEKAIGKMKGGGYEDVKLYNLTNESKNEICKKIKTDKNIYKGQLSMVNDCF